MLDDYVRLPALLDDRGVDVVLIEHEFGIFGGDAGSHLLSLVRDLHQPFVLTLHTVLAEPSPGQARTLLRSSAPEQLSSPCSPKQRGAWSSIPAW